MSSHNGGGHGSSSRVTPSVVVSAAADPEQVADGSEDARRYWTTRQAGSWLLSPVYEQRSDGSSSTGGGVLGGFLTLLGAGAGRRRPLRSTSFSNVASCTAGSATTSTATAPVMSVGAAADERRGTLSTARPLRVYTRSSTDTELYRRRPGAARPPAGYVVVRQRFSEQHGRPLD